MAFNPFDNLGGTLNSAFQEALINARKTPQYRNVNQLASMFGIQTPEPLQRITSPVPEINTLNEDWKSSR